MTILVVSNTPADFGNMALTTGTDERDTLYSPSGLLAQSKIAAALPEWTAPSGILWFHFRMRTPPYSDNSGADGYLLHFYDANGDLVGGIDWNNGYFRAVSVGASTVYGAEVLSVQTTNYTFDVSLDYTGGNITVDIYQGGGASVSKAISAVGTKGVPVRATMHMNDITSVNPSDVYFSEFIVTDGEDTRGWRLATLEPNLNGNYNQWTGDVNELGDNDPATLASTATNGNRQSWTPTTYNGPASPSSIRAVIGRANAGRGPAGLSQITQFVRISSTDYDGTPQALAAGEQKALMEVWDNNPATASPWATADLASLEMGLLANT